MKKSVFIALAILVMGCTAEVPEAPERLVVEGWIEAGMAPVVYVSTTMAPKVQKQSIEDFSEHIVRWAKVTISDGTDEVILTGVASKHFFPPYAYTTGRMTGEVGKTYSIKVEYGGSTAEASACIPAPVPLNALEPVPDAVADEYVLRARFDDNPLTKDYYRFFCMVEGVDSTYAPVALGLGSDDYIEGSAEVTIRPFRGLQRNTNTTTFHTGDRVRVKFSTMEASMYRFWDAYEQQYALANLPIFSLDRNLPGNVRGGLGYFAGYGSTVYSIDIPE